MNALGPFNVSEPLDEAVVAIPDGEQPGGEGAKILFHPETVIPPLELIRQEEFPQETPFRAERRQVFIQQMTVHLFTDI